MINPALAIIALSGTEQQDCGCGAVGETVEEIIPARTFWTAVGIAAGLAALCFWAGTAPDRRRA